MSEPERPRSVWAGIPAWALLTPALIALALIAVAVWKLVL